MEQVLSHAPKCGSGNNQNAHTALSWARNCWRL